MKRNGFALLLGGAMLLGAGGCGDTHKIPSGAPKADSEAVNIDMGGGTDSSKEPAPPAGETPPATEAAPPSGSAAPPAENSAAPTEKTPAAPAEK